jgi:hypothetical protein
MGTKLHLMVLALLIIATAGCTGCITIAKTAGSEEPDATPSPATTSRHTALPPPEVPPSLLTTSILSAEDGSIAETGYTESVRPADPVPAQPGESLPKDNPCNVPSLAAGERPAKSTNKVNLTVVYSGTHVLNDSAVGLQVDATEAPFYISFDVTPNYPETVRRCTLAVSVREAETLRLVADEGYDGIYSSEPEKMIMLYSPGTYIVTLDGQYVTVAVAMGTAKTLAG